MNDKLETINGNIKQKMNNNDSKDYNNDKVKNKTINGINYEKDENSEEDEDEILKEIKMNAKKRVSRKPGSRTHERVYSSKKRKSLVDKYGKPITNTSRINVDTSKKKEKKERLENRKSIEISVGKKKKII